MSKWPLMNMVQQVSMYHTIKRHGQPQSVTMISGGELEVGFGAYYLYIDASGIVRVQS